MMKGIRIVTVVENTQGVHKGLRAEHGISFYVELRGKQLLFDTGPSSAVLDNAAKLKLDLSRLDALCLSHGHYDHSGGVRHLVQEGVRPPVWVGKGFFGGKYAKNGTTYEYVGNDFDQDFLNRNGITYREVESDVEEVLPGAFVVTRFERVYPDETINPRFWVWKDGKFEPDTFSDELLLVLETPRGLVVLLGCSHPGVKNMLDTVRERFPQPIHAVLGGTHLVEASDPSLDESLKYFSSGVVELVGVSHCTGNKASNSIRQYVRGAFANHTGSMLWVE